MKSRRPQLQDVHYWYPRRDPIIWWCFDLLVFLLVHWSANVGVWSNNWSDPDRSLFLQAHSTFLLYDLITYHTYKQLSARQLNLPESLGFALWTLHGFRLYTLTYMVFMATARLEADPYSLPSYQQVLVSVGLFVYFGFHAAYDLGLFDCAGAEPVLIPVACDPRTAQRDVRASHDGSVVVYQDRAHRQDHVWRVNPDTGALKGEINRLPAYQEPIHTAQHQAVTQGECDACAQEQGRLHQPLQHHNAVFCASHVVHKVSAPPSYSTAVQHKTQE